MSLDGLQEHWKAFLTDLNPEDPRSAVLKCMGFQKRVSWDAQPAAGRILCQDGKLEGRVLRLTIV